MQWGQGDSVATTLAALSQIRDDFAAHPAVAAIELLNEPMGPQIGMGLLQQFMDAGYGQLQGTDVAVAFHDAFQGVTGWNAWGADRPGLLLDTHHYQVFDTSLR